MGPLGLLELTAEGGIVAHGEDEGLGLCVSGSGDLGILGASTHDCCTCMKPKHSHITEKMT